MDSIGVTTGALLPWPQTGPPILWRASVGAGFSSLAVTGGRAFTLGNRNGSDTALGAGQWTSVDATPVTDGDRFRVSVVPSAPSLFFRLERR